MRVLLVDDYDLVRDTLGAMLERLDHVVMTASNASEALCIYQEELPQVVVTDYGLPGISGLELAKDVKELNPATPVVLITGWSVELSEQQLKSRGVDFLLHKPFRWQDVEGVLSQCARLLAEGTS